MGIKERIKKLERRPIAPQGPGPSALEVQQIDKRIVELTEEINSIRATMTPEELAIANAEEEKTAAKAHRLVGLYGFDAAIEWLEVQIRMQEQELAEGESALCHAQGEGDT